jgi:hypothetical protein
MTTCRKFRGTPSESRGTVVCRGTPVENHCPTRTIDRLSQYIRGQLITNITLHLMTKLSVINAFLLGSNVYS